jgi:gamma-tubulin complex component 3
MKEANDHVASTRQRQLEYLQSLRFQSALGDVNEDVLVRDLLFVFQGIDGNFIKFELLADAYTLAPNVTVTPSTHKLISELCEVGWLFRKVNEWLARSSKDQQTSQVIQSLSFAVQGELTEYYRLLAVLES